MPFRFTSHLSGRLFSSVLAAFGLLAALVPVTAGAQVNTRPISDFINSQVLVTGGSSSVAWFDPANGRILGVDYTGKTDAYIVAHGGTDQGTTVSGTILERPLKDGTAEVTVLLHIQNSVTWAWQPIGNGYPLVFGHFPADIIVGRDAALATVNLNLRLHISASGAPLPDLLVAFNTGAAEFTQLNVISRGTFRAAYGVPDGTPGFAQSTDTGVLQSHGKGGPRGDYFPAEHIDFHVSH